MAVDQGRTFSLKKRDKTGFCFGESHTCCFSFLINSEGEISIRSLSRRQPVQNMVVSKQPDQQKDRGRRYLFCTDAPGPRWLLLWVRDNKPRFRTVLTITTRSPRTGPRRRTGALFPAPPWLSMQAPSRNTISSLSQEISLPTWMAAVRPPEVSPTLRLDARRHTAGE